MNRAAWAMIVGFAAFSVGLALYVSRLNYKAWRLGDSKAMLHLIGARVGYGLVVVSSRRIYQPQIAFDWHDWIYITGLIASAVFFVLLALDLRKRFRRGDWDWLHHGLGPKED